MRATSTSDYRSWEAGRKTIKYVLFGITMFVLGHVSQQQQETAAVFAYHDKDIAARNSETHCKKTLDALDQSFDARRKARQDARNKFNDANDKTVYDLYEPESVCFDDERFGSKSLKRYRAFGDGPKFLCGVDRLVEQAKNFTSGTKPCLIYNVGSNNQIEFEKASSLTFGKGCEIHTFDPTVRPEEYIGAAYSTFHDWGLGVDGTKMHKKHSRGTFDFTVYSVETIIKKLGHQGRRIDIFKIDCEGCEYAAVTEAFKAIKDGNLEIGQLQLEMHGLYRDKIPQLFKAADAAKMRVFHKERNHWGCKGYTCVEYAFVSEGFLRKANSHYVCGPNNAADDNLSW